MHEISIQGHVTCLQALARMTIYPINPRFLDTSYICYFSVVDSSRHSSAHPSMICSLVLMYQ